MPEPRTELIQIRVSPADQAAIKKAAEKRGMTVSEFGRASMLAMMTIDLDPHAVRMFSRGVFDAVQEKLSQLTVRSKRTA